MPKIPTPAELGLPPKFDKWRPCQEAALDFLAVNRSKRVRMTCVPTGGGKSAINVAEAVLSGLPTAIVTQTIGLQKQYMDDFGPMGMVSLMGRNRYTCGMRDEFTCEDGYAARCPYKGSTSCPSTQAELRARLSNLVVTNYAKWTSAKKAGQGMDHFQQVIFDEGDVAPEQLASAMRIELNHHECEEELWLQFPSNLRFTKDWDPDLNKENVKVWKGWAREAKVTVEEELAETINKVRNVEAKPTWVKRISHLRNLVRRLTIIATAQPDNWVVDHQDKGYVFDPIRPGRYAEVYLLLRMDKILFTSATNRPKTLHLCGVYSGSSWKQHRNGAIETDNYIFQEYDSEFDPRDCPIYYIPTQCVDRRHPDNSQLWLRMDQWLGRRFDRRQIIHTVSYSRREEIMGISRYASAMIFNERGEPTTEIISDFVNGPPNGILVTPSMGRGYDFPGTACESAFMCKIPFEPPSKIVQARQNDDPEYRGYRAIQAIEQAAGRHNRFPGDRGDFAIPDDNMRWFKRQNEHLASRNFNRRYRVVDIVPPPLKKM